jgi:hypothetical protein
MTDRLTKEQAAIIGAYTGVLCGDFSDLLELIERVMGRPVRTHEMADKEFMEKLREAVKPEFMSICAVREGEQQ